jgi:hypothetical protein
LETAEQAARSCGYTLQAERMYALDKALDETRPRGKLEFGYVLGEEC